MIGPIMLFADGYNILSARRDFVRQRRDLFVITSCNCGIAQSGELHTVASGESYRDCAAHDKTQRTKGHAQTSKEFPEDRMSNGIHAMPGQHREQSGVKNARYRHEEQEVGVVQSEPS